MLLTIHNLPPGTQSNAVRELIISKCGLKELILDNLQSEGVGMHFTVRVPSEEHAAILVRKINGLYYRGHQLYVKDKRQKQGSEQPYRVNSSKSMPQPFQQAQGPPPAYTQEQATGIWPQQAMANFGYPNQPVTQTAIGFQAVQSVYTAYGQQQLSEPLAQYSGTIQEYGQLAHDTQDNDQQSYGRQDYDQRDDDQQAYADDEPQRMSSYLRRPNLPPQAKSGTEPQWNSRRQPAPAPRPVLGYMPPEAKRPKWDSNARPGFGLDRNDMFREERGHAGGAGVTFPQRVRPDGGERQPVPSASRTQLDSRNLPARRDQPGNHNQAGHRAQLGYRFQLDNRSKPDNFGQPDNRSKPDNRGQPDYRGQPDNRGQPDYRSQNKIMSFSEVRGKAESAMAVGATGADPGPGQKKNGRKRQPNPEKKRRQRERKAKATSDAGMKGPAFARSFPIKSSNGNTSSTNPKVSTAAATAAGDSEQPLPHPPEKIPNYLKGDKKLNSRLKKKGKLELETLECYELPEILKTAMEDEIQTISHLIEKVFNEPQSDNEKSILKNVNQVHGISVVISTCVKFLMHHTSKRLSNAGMKLVRIYGHPRPPNRQALQAFLAPLGCTSLKKSANSPFFTASFERYDVVDRLCGMGSVAVGNDCMADFKHMYVTPRKPKYSQQHWKSRRKKHIHSLIDFSRVNLLDKDWQAQDAAEKSARANLLVEDSDDVIYIENNVKIDVIDITDNQTSENVANNTEDEKGFLHQDFKVIDEVRASDNDGDDNIFQKSKEIDKFDDDWGQSGNDWSDMKADEIAGGSAKNTATDDNVAGEDENAAEDDKNTVKKDENTAGDDENTAGVDGNAVADDKNTAEGDDNFKVDIRIKDDENGTGGHENKVEGNEIKADYYDDKNDDEVADVDWNNVDDDDIEDY